MSTQIERHYSVLSRQVSGNVVPPMRVRRAAVEQEERRVCRSSPLEVMKGKITDRDETVERMVCCWMVMGTEGFC